MVTIRAPLEPVEPVILQREVSLFQALLLVVTEVLEDMALAMLSGLVLKDMVQVVVVLPVASLGLAALAVAEQTEATHTVPAVVVASAGTMEALALGQTRLLSITAMPEAVVVLAEPERMVHLTLQTIIP